jgi:DNA topoisomerase-1
VKTLEEFDIGRPSTYASIISTLVAREYVHLEGKAFIPTDVGMIVYRFLTEHFAHYVDYQFTAHLEDELDEISRGEREWVPVLKEFWAEFKPIIDEKMELKRTDISEDRQLGTDPVSGRPVSARLGRFGPMVQIGAKDDVEKPKFAGIPGKLRIDTITLAQALDLFKLPRKLGQTQGGDEIEVNIGRFGPYVRYGKQFVSLKKDDDPYTVELPRALELIEGKRLAIEAATIKRFQENGADIRVIKGRFGPYINDGTRKARIPRGKDAESLTQAECEALLLEQNPEKKTKKAAKKKAEAPATEGAAPAAKAAPKAKKKAPAKKKAAAPKP